MTIKNNFEISLDKFINFALYDKKKGYYMQKNPFGLKGDFITAPNISRMFSEMLAIWILGFWENLENPKKINLVFTTGGYISAPTIVASKLLKIPIIIHESNVVPGMVTKYFGFLCNYVLLGFKETNSYLKNCKTIFTGTPLREQFYKFNTLPEWVPKGKGPLLIVMGGSQGAKAINQIIYDSLEFLMKKKFRIVHIIGECNKYSFNLKNSKNYVQKKFTNEIAGLIQNCDLVISRSGAGTINELIETEKPSILIPFPYSKNDHQEKNALILAESGGSVLMNQKTITKEVFEETQERIFKIKSKKGKKYYEK